MTWYLVLLRVHIYLFSIFINDFREISQNSFLLLFIDDLKINKKISSKEDKLKLQNGLNKLSIWWKNNGLNLDHEKCFQITFLKDILDYSGYSINSLELNKTLI